MIQLVLTTIILRGDIMRFNFSGKQDVYIEVAEKYREYIKLGLIKNGDKLPSIRMAASELGINPNTMARAYTLLEDEGYISSIPKKGIYVTYADTQNTVSEQKNITLPCIEAIEKLKNEGYSKEQILNAIEEVYHD